MSKQAVLFGLNYTGTNNELRGCINDVENMAEWLKMRDFTCDIYCDYKSTCAKEIVDKLNHMARRSHEEIIDTIWIHYSGHGTSILDRSRDERDGKDECLVASDNVLIPDDFISRLFKGFHKRTKVIFVADCCHSGTISDVTYVWDCETLVPRIDYNENTYDTHIITISGCKDDQTSADAYLPNYETKKNEFSGAMTTHLLKILQSNENNVFEICKSLNKMLKRARFTQRPVLSSSYDLRKDANLL